MKGCEMKRQRNNKSSNGSPLGAVASAWEKCIEAVRGDNKEAYLRSLAWVGKVITLCNVYRCKLSEELALARARGVDWGSEIVPLSERDELAFINDSQLHVRALIAGIQRAASDYMARFPDATAQETQAALESDKAFKMTMAQVTAIVDCQNALSEFATWLETDASAAWLKAAVNKAAEPDTARVA